jgi:UDP-N-acetylglucosamine:LPS N-acetylglucosamine transferase
MANNICIYFSDTGGGHRSAAEAIEAALETLVAAADYSPGIHVVKDNIAEKTNALNRGFVELYNQIMRHCQPLMKYYWRFIHTLQPERGLNIAITERFHMELLQRDEPSVVVSVHPMINEFLAHALGKLGLAGKVKFLVVITDPSEILWRPWACTRADLIIAPNQVVKNRLVEFGVDADRVAVLGMPIHQDFLKPPSIPRSEFLNHLGLKPDVLTICVNAGWAGTGNMLKIYEALSKVNRPIQAIFLCGRNPGLYQEAMAAAANSRVATAVLPFHDCMPDLMAAVDIMVTKAGGLTTYQALARRLALVFDSITEPMPQEGRTIEILVEQKLAQQVKSARDIIDIVESFEPVAERESANLTSNYQIDLTDGAIFEIARTILEYNAPPIILSRAKKEHELCDLRAKSTASQAAGET